MKARLIAVAIHALASATVAGIVAALILFVWFPGDFSSLMRGGKLLAMVALCDVTLGPLLSLVVYDPEKSRRALVFDYSVIVAAQLAALVYGASVIAGSRPVFTVFAIDRFEVVAAAEVTVGPEDAGSRLQPSWFGPQLAELQLPAGGAERNRAIELELAGHLVSGMPRYLQPYRQAAAQAKAQPMAALLARFPARRADVDRVAARAGLKAEDLSWLPVKTGFGFGTALLAPGHEGIAGFLDQDPY